jgi:hypothetical protein
VKRLVIGFLLTAATAGATDVTIGGNTYTLQSHPRVLLDGAAGTITARVKDPDGAGPLVAPQALDGDPAFEGLKSQVRECVASPDYCSGRYERSTTLLLMALDWYMDNSQTDSLAAAKYTLNNVETWVQSYYQFACDVSFECGISSWNDWSSWDAVNIAQAYSLIQSQLSAGEKAAFVQKMFNDDVVGYEDGCTNQLQIESGATATFTTGSTAVTGTNLSGLTAGRMIYIQATLTSGGYWATIQTVNSSTSITLVAAPIYAAGSAAPGVTAGLVSEMKPWSSTTCGLAWSQQHHKWSPPSISGRVIANTAFPEYTSGSSTITVASTAGLPSPPFYIFVNTEIMRVTGINGVILSVDRAQFGTTAMNGQYPPRAVIYSRALPTVHYDDPAMNLTIQKVIGYLVMGLALADESARARQYVTWAADFWKNEVLPKNQDVWTGFQQGGSTNYGSGRQITENMMVVQMLRLIPGSPSLDYKGTKWLAGLTEAYLYTLLPTSTTAFAPWGQADIADSPSYYTHMWAPIQTCIYGESSDRAKYFNYWQRTISSNYVAGTLTDGANERIIPFALMCWQQSDTSTDYRSVLPTQKAFYDVEGSAAKAMGAFVSRSGWTASTDTLLFATSFSFYYGIDHQGSGAPGAYRVFKNGWVLTENGARDTGINTDTNMVLFGGSSQLKSTVAGQSTVVDKTDSGVGWAFSRINTSAAYQSALGVTRALRYLLHFKKAASPDYVVVYDDMATSVANTLSQNLHFDKTLNQASSITDTLPDIVWTGPNRRVSTKIVLPSGTGVARTPTSLTNSFRENICASSDGSTCAATTSAAFLLVHRPSASTSDTMPTVAALGTIDSNYSGVQIEGEAPSIAVFPKAGLYHASTSFTSTHSGTAQYVVTGLESGIYDVVRGATTIVDDETIDSNGTIAFESVAGAFTITRAGEVPAITITTTTLSNAVQYESYSAQLAYTGGTPPVTWTVSAGTICTGLSLSTSGAISGTATVGQTCNFTAKVVDAAAAEDTQALAITVQTPPPSLTVTATPGSTSVVVQFGTPTLAENQSCDVVVSSSALDPGTGLPIGPVANATSASGSSTRSVSLSGLAPSTSHTAQVTCGTVASGSTSFVTLAESTPGGGGTVSWTYTVKPHARLVARSVTKVSVGYQLVTDPPSTPDFVDSACATGCTVTLPLISGQTYYITHIWRTAADAVVAQSRAALVAVP